MKCHPKCSKARLVLIKSNRTRNQRLVANYQFIGRLVYAVPLTPLAAAGVGTAKGVVCMEMLLAPELLPFTSDGKFPVMLTDDGT